MQNLQNIPEPFDIGSQAESANRICGRPWQERNVTSRMKVKRLSYRRVISFLSEEGIYDDDKSDKATTYTKATTKENHLDDHDDMVTVAYDEDEPRAGDNPKASFFQLVDNITTCPMIPVNVILPATISPPPTTATDATTPAKATASLLDANSTSTGLPS
jgi:hypothetical protein